MKRVRVVAVLMIGCGLVALTAAQAANRALPTSPSADAQCPTRHHLTVGQPTIGTLRLPLVLDGGRLTATPPGSGDEPFVPAVLALDEFRSTEEVAGFYGCATFGLAHVTTRLLNSTGFTTASRLAWLGLAEFRLQHCPLITFHPEIQPEPVDVVIVDADDPHHVEVYTSSGSYCAEPLAGPTLSPAHRVVSVTFTGQDFGLITYELPLCGTAYDISSSVSMTSRPVIGVHVAVPFGREDCGTRRVTVSSGLPYEAVLEAQHEPVGPTVVLSS